MTDFEILFWTAELLALMWIVYHTGYFLGRRKGFDTAIAIIDEDLRRLKKIVEESPTK
jgi:hypothetical protein